MDAVTYPDAEVSSFITQHMIPLRVQWNDEPLATNFNVRWTPTIITLDPEGREHHRTVGYLPPEELVPSLLLGTAKAHFDSGQYDLALQSLQEVLSRYPDSDSAPEALYLSGVSRYKRSGDARYLKEIQRNLESQYPESVWAKRATVYQRLPEPKAA